MREARPHTACEWWSEGCAEIGEKSVEEGMARHVRSPERVGPTRKKARAAVHRGQSGTPRPPLSIDPPVSGIVAEYGKDSCANGFLRARHEEAAHPMNLRGVHCTDGGGEGQRSAHTAAHLPLPLPPAG